MALTLAEHRVVVLVLEGQPGLKPGAVAESLRGYSGGQMPFEALLLDFHGADYHFSSDDIGGLLSAIAAFVRGRVAQATRALRVAVER